jgi:hypothetical protein
MEIVGRPVVPLSKRLLVVLVLCWAIHGGTAAAIDWSPIGLGSLIAASDAVVVGTVKSVAESTTPGATSGVIQVEHSLAGSPPPALVLERTADATDEPLFQPGDRVLLFVRRLDNGTQADFAVVDPRGVVAVRTQGALAATLGIMKLALAKQFSLKDDRPFLAPSAEPAPPRLIAWLLEELKAHLTENDAPALAAIACGVDQGVVPAAQVWAIGRVGPLGVSDARLCLEALATDGKNPALRLLAIAALGDLRDRRSLRVLLPLVELAPKPPEDGRARPGDHVVATVLALGKIGDPSVVNDLVRLTHGTDDTALHSAIVHALGLIGGPTVHGPLTKISKTDPSPSVRHQAARTLQRLEATTEKGP